MRGEKQSYCARHHALDSKRRRKQQRDELEQLRAMAAQLGEPALR